MAAIFEFEKCEVFDQTYFVVGEVATIANPLFTKCHTIDVI